MTSDKVSTTPGPRQLRVPVGAGAGLTGHGESYVDATSLSTVSNAQLRRRAATAGWLRQNSPLSNSATAEVS